MHARDRKPGIDPYATVVVAPIPTLDHAGPALTHNDLESPASPDARHDLAPSRRHR